MTGRANRFERRQRENDSSIVAAVSGGVRAQQGIRGSGGEIVVNVRLLKKVRKLIAEEPRRMHMGTWGYWVSERQASDFPREYPPCGTVACLAGWTLLADKPMSEWKDTLGSPLFDYSWAETELTAQAADKLGIPLDKCPFFRTNWRPYQVLRWIDRQIAKAVRQ
jgi:hypothetical protein